MLHIRDEDGWKQLDQDAVIEGILSRRLSADTQARDERGSGREEPLEQALPADVASALGVRLLREVRGVYNGDAPCLSLRELEARVGELARWNLPATNRTTRLRLAWLAAWLAELLGRAHQGVRRYELFLGLNPVEDTPGLYWLAMNNRAVLLLRQGQLHALPELARAALEGSL